MPEWQLSEAERSEAQQIARQFILPGFR
jgi:hypothetical protein